MFIYVKQFSFKKYLGRIYFLQQSSGFHGPIKEELQDSCFIHLLLHNETHHKLVKSFPYLKARQVSRQLRMQPHLL